MNKLEGVIVPVAVPLQKSAKPDLGALQTLTGHLIASGIHGLFANGSMGGFAFHEDADQMAIVETVWRANNGRKPFLAGVSDTSVSRVLARIRALQHVAVDAYVVLPPYYYIYDQPALQRFFSLIADAAPRPIILYENPRLAHNSVAPATIFALARHPNVAGLKISTPDPDLWRTLLDGDLPRDRFALICGAEKMMSTGLRMGFDGMTGGFHNVVPSLAVDLYRAARAGDSAEADLLQETLNRAYRIFEIAGGWRGLEIAWRQMGIATYAAPVPFDTPATPEQTREILDILGKEIGVTA